MVTGGCDVTGEWWMGNTKKFGEGNTKELENPKRQLLQRRTGTTLGLVSGLSGKGVYEVRSVPLCISVKKEATVAKKPIPKVIFKALIPNKGCVLGLANVETWDNIVKKYRMRTHERYCAKQVKGEKKGLMLKVESRELFCDDVQMEPTMQKMRMEPTFRSETRDLFVSTRFEDSIWEVRWIKNQEINIGMKSRRNQLEIENKEIEADEEPSRGIMWLKGRVNKDGEFTNDEIRSVGDKLKEADDKIKEGTINLDYGTDAMTVVFGKEKGGYARGATDERIELLQTQLDNERHEHQQKDELVKKLSTEMTEKDVLVNKLSNEMTETKGMLSQLMNQLAAQGVQLNLSS
ncbi:hypothetical protein Tco_0323080 [Tanacetum coccineum]